MPTILVTLDVVPPDIPALLGLDLLDLHRLTPDTVLNRLVKRIIATMEDGKDYAIDDWNVPLLRSDGHIYASICFPIDTFFSKPPLKKIHPNFWHPSADKLFKLLKRARPDETTP